MSIVTVAELEAYLNATDDGRYQSYLDASELAVGAYIGAQDGIEETASFEEVVYVGAASPRLSITDGPMAAVDQVEQNASGTGTSFETVLAAELKILTPWLLERLSLTPVFPHGAVLKVTFTKGWNSTSLPSQVRQAILNTAEWRATTNPDGGLQSESIGDYSYTRATASSAGDALTVPPSAMSYLERFKRPSFQ